jgi:hypothetical protein
MATNKKRATKSKKTRAKKVTPTKESAKTKRTLKKLAKKSAPNKMAKGKTSIGKTTGRKMVHASKKQTQTKSPRVGTVAFSREEPESHSGGQSGDLQGLSSVAAADSESVDELLEEGNAFEAEAVTGVEDAGRQGQKEVRTHEVPEDDVPAEYLDKDE